MNRNSSLTAPANGLFIRSWHKSIPPKAAHERLGLYCGSWSTQMDRYWESNDGFAVSSRQIHTAWGTVEHVAINRMNGDSRDVPWAIKQQIKDELFGSRRVTIEVYPSQKNLIDTCDVYHLWVLPKDFVLPFGIHPTRDPQGKPVERGYDFSLEDAVAWTESEERKQLILKTKSAREGCTNCNDVSIAEKEQPYKELLTRLEIVAEIM